jgi:hypothetical protein
MIELLGYSRPVKSLRVVDCCTPRTGSSLTEAEAVELERVFRALADRHRVRILKQLTDAGLLVRGRRRTFAYYQLAPRALERLSALVAEPQGLAKAV